MLPNAFYMKEDGETPSLGTRKSLRLKSSRSYVPQQLLDSSDDGGSISLSEPPSSDDNSCDSFGSSDAAQTRGRGKAKAKRQTRSPSSSPHRPSLTKEEEDLIARRTQSINENKAMLAKLMAELEPVCVKKPRAQVKPKEEKAYVPPRKLPGRSCVTGLYRPQTRTPAPKKARQKPEWVCLLCGRKCSHCL